ncbi:uncharacterized protein LOC132730759 isoform X2 [Ruditapes philippinarum]|uniref:uncharacterized protein LOC132730759 isoform X2 n=1 Tax=Ruditapes philippinarum TaxID=129788 RepID=UPI00295BC1DB|nr:uncharacterized protein LOC132730759 isoform X2 [Ruditapes philippinarum]
MVLIYIGLLLVVAVSGGECLTCLQCDGVLQPRFCRRVVDCYDGELCSAMRVVNEFGEQVYNLGCHTRKVCGNITTSSSTKQCANCCETNLCNSEACGEPGYPLNRGPVCFNCPSHTSTGLCHDIDFCFEDETCNIVGRQLFSSEVLTSKCVSKHACRDQTGSHISIIGKREVSNVKRTRQQTCDLCCHDDLCNRNCLTASNIPDKDECTSNPCGFGGTCYDTMNGYNCICAPGFSGINCETELQADCSGIKHHNVNATDGVYSVLTWKTNRTIQVYCDMRTVGGGWTVFQNRFDGSVNFTRSFSEYVNGFGDIHTEFWLGLENLHELVSQGNYELRIDVTAANGSKGYETFPNFTISAGSNYTLHILPGHGSIGDNGTQGMLLHNGMPFSTFDHDRDHYNGNCAQVYKSGWWYNKCMFVHLNGVYDLPGTTDTSAMSYYMFTNGEYISLKTSRMMFREV